MVNLRQREKALPFYRSCGGHRLYDGFLFPAYRHVYVSFICGYLCDLWANVFVLKDLKGENDYSFPSCCQLEVATRFIQIWEANRYHPWNLKSILWAYDFLYNSYHTVFPGWQGQAEGSLQTGGIQPGITGASCGSGKLFCGYRDDILVGYLEFQSSPGCLSNNQPGTIPPGSITHLLKLS